MDVIPFLLRDRSAYLRAHVTAHGTTTRRGLATVLAIVLGGDGRRLVNFL
jgi:hypothetical protein